jgi:glutaminyl-tRNA synthetase
MARETGGLPRARHVSPNFITEIIDADLRANRYAGVRTRFPPEPNGYLHIGHAKSICLNFGLALDYGGECNLRFDDTNPETERLEYAEAMKRDVEWLGFRWTRERYTSDYFERLYACAVQLIREGRAYVDSLSDEEISRYRGTVAAPGTPSPYRDRTVDENLALFTRMRGGEFPNGAHVLRAKIDLASPNMKLRDPVLYRIVHAGHYHAGDAWCIYPLYDFAHPLSDAFEGISHSLCTLEFENNRAIYDWLIEHLRGTCGIPASPRPHQYEFARLNLDYTVLSKRKLIRLVEEGRVEGWDDPRMPTLSGLRRRGVPPEAIRVFANRIGVAKTNSRVGPGVFDAAVRDDLNYRSPRVLAVLRPLAVTITNYPNGRTERLVAPYWPHDVPRDGSREVPFSGRLYIERDDFLEHPPHGFHRLTPGGRVRLRHAYVIRCDEVIRNAAGDVVELRCTYDPHTLGRAPDGGRIKGTIHWVSTAHALPITARLYDRLFTVADPEKGDGDFTAHLNPASLAVAGGYVEPSVAGDPPDTRYQFERLGYFWRDPVECTPQRLVFNRIATLRDPWTKAQQRGRGRASTEGHDSLTESTK